MKKLVNLALTVGAVAGTVYYLQQKGILSINASEKEDGGRTIEVKVDLPKKPEAAEEAEEEENDVAEAAKDVADAAEDLVEALGSSATDAMDELSRDIDSMLESMREAPEGQL